ncbi:MAG: GAF domain-containing protein [Chloroflexi bacterium]|nr:GAF domain-containing protein [Chloroflexota bacterium]
MRLILAVSAWVLYTLAFAPAFSVAGDAASTLVTVPVVVTAWLFGLRGGLWAALLNIPLTSLLFNLAGQSGPEIMIRLWPGILAGLMIGVVTGWLSDLLRLVRQQSRELISEREALKEQIAERQRAEEALRRAGDELESRVRERTAELARVNAVLQADVAERRQTEAALKREQKLFEHGPVVVVSWSANENWPVKYISPNVAEQWGYQAEDFTSGRLPYARLIHPDDLDRIALEVRANNASDAPSFSQVYRIIRADGEVRWVGDFTLVTRDETGTHYDGYVFDITARRQMEESLAHYNAEVAEILAREQRLNEVARLISGALELSTVLSTVVRLAAELIGAEAGAMALVTGDGQTITFPFIFNLRESLTLQPLARGKGIAWQIVLSGEPVLLDDYRAHPQALPDWVTAGIRAFIGVPVVVGEACLGVLGLFYLNPDRRFIRRDLAMAQLVGRQAGVAIQNARLFEANRQRVAALTALHETSLALSAQLDLPALLRTIIERAAMMLEAPMGELKMLQPDGQTLAPIVGYNPQPDIAPTPLRLGEGLSGQVAQSGNPLVVGDYQMWPGRVGAYAAGPIRAAVGVPIKWQGKVLGVINIMDHRPDRFSPADVELVSLFADQAAVAIENVRLFEANRQRVAALTALHETSLALSAQLDLPALLRTITERAARLLEAPMGGFYLLLPDEQTLELVVSYNNDRDYTGYRLRLGEGLSGKVAQTGEPMIIGDYHEWEGRAAVYEQAPFRAVLALPIKWQGKVLGVITTNDNRPNRFGLADLELVSLFADQAAVAIVNARLFESLEHREEYFRALIENAAEGITIVDKEGVIRYQSPSFERILGYSPADYVGQHVLAPSLIHPDDLPVALVFAQNLQVSGVIETVEIRIQHKNGQWRNLEVIGHNLADNPRVAGVVLNYRDVTERKQAEEQLRKLSRAVEQSPASVIITDTAGNIEYVNPRFAHVTGYTFEEVQGLNPRILKSGRTPPEVYKQLWDTIAAGGEWRGEIHNKKKNGELYWELASISSILDASGAITHFLAVQEDITERKQTEAALAIANADLERALLNANELAVAAQAANRAKSEFLANTSHEIRTPLTAVLGLTELILDTDLNPEQRESLQQVHASGETLLELLNNILDLSSIEADRLTLAHTKFELPALLEQVMSTLASRAAARNLRFSHSLNANTPPILVGDPTRLRQVLLNLLDNAIKFTERGEVTLQAQVERESAAKIVLHFVVKDTGIGVPKDKQALIFAPFVQADGHTTRKYGGTGLGLAISEKLVKKFGGHLWVESEPGLGSAFHFTAIFELPPNN